MRNFIISFIKNHPGIANFLWDGMRICLRIMGFFIPVNKKSIIFSSFGGRRFDDSPRALYDKICSMEEFRDWKLIWAFIEPEKIEIPRGEKVKIDTWPFFKALLSTYVWIGNSEIDRGIRLFSSKHIRIETWHGTPLKKICGEENQTSVEKVSKSRKLDNTTIRCSQSEYDRNIFSRIFTASKDSILLSDLPRNDSLLMYSEEEINGIREKLNIDKSKKVILYTPTFREYETDEKGENAIAPPITFDKWERLLGENYVLLVRAHYVVTKAMNLPNTSFVKDVSKYESLNDLYVISDLMISDYSSTFFDYSILNRPMLCFAYDWEEYTEKRGLYLDLEKELPCEIDKNEDALLNHILNLDYSKASDMTKQFQMKYAPFAGNSCEMVINALLTRLKL